MKTESAMNDIELLFDERNLAHVFTALALAGIADSASEVSFDSRCSWTEGGFKLRVPTTKEQLFISAHAFAKSLRWTAGLGCDDKKQMKSSPHHGLLTADGSRSINPLLNYADGGITSSIFKTFSGQLNPTKLLAKQIAELKAVGETPDWLFQHGKGVASWKFDCRVASHAYDQGYSANEEGSGEATPFYPAIELLGIAGAAFFSSPTAWFVSEDALVYRIWQEPVSLALAPLAAANLLDGINGCLYGLATRGNAYGKGAAYRHFPEATPIA
jgi:hypothetical protein